MRTWLVAAAALLGACAQERPTEKQAEAASCAAAAASVWRELRVEASSAGVDCESANAAIVLRNSAGEGLYSETFPAAQVLTLATARTQAGMQAALSEWIASSNHSMDTSGALPDWPQGADAPVSGEFPFYPREGMTRDAYMNLRRANVPLFCFVQGMESMACLALEGGAVAKAGVQAFPG
jgi:hypothetical protein